MKFSYSKQSLLMFIRSLSIILLCGPSVLSKLNYWQFQKRIAKFFPTISHLSYEDYYYYYYYVYSYTRYRNNNEHYTKTTKISSVSWSLNALNLESVLSPRPFFQDQDPVVQDQDQDLSFKTETFCLTTDNTLSQKWQNIDTVRPTCTVYVKKSNKWGTYQVVILYLYII